MDRSDADGGTERARRDALLVVRAQLGDRRALAELVGRWHAPVWRYVRRMLGASGDADDVSQEVWAAALRALPRLDRPGRFAPWLYTIARRSVMNQLRAGYDARRAGAGDPEDAGHVTEEEAGAVLDRAQVAEGLAALVPREREVLILFHLEDLSLEECAQVLAVPVGTVKSRLFHARRSLRARLIEKGYTS
ncbi:sigma-70 family RNA polymerase sigma factor [Sphaerisporangium sp. TRM90804]|uniref:RNA polymerase sigma factor n=1 Tax=Sphaerisporangium sp. TRM90804 TaxID=3031113 RepID=UPI002449C309|nr:sigma-70 family RNA polymerase sigma factor [Sphaerisporangium sp. TRM90804]MDH2428510.1 sigma-70 family RNA polymerase sigma factor [Sphaerisporangium sp. TRM90804]